MTHANLSPTPSDKDKSPDRGKTGEHAVANADVVPASPIAGGDLRQESFQRKGTALQSELTDLWDRRSYHAQNWQGSFSEYLGIVQENPRAAQGAYQRLYNMILSHGVDKYQDDVTREQLVRYKIFDDPFNGGRDAIKGLDKQLMEFMAMLKAAANDMGMERRVILLHGPVGTAKSTIIRLFKRGLEEYSKTDEGALYTFGIVKNLAEKDDPNAVKWSQMHQDPLTVISTFEPAQQRKFLARLNSQREPGTDEVRLRCELSPDMRVEVKELLQQYDGDIRKVFDHIKVKRILISEKDRVGIGTFQPKDEKNQDATELTGDINYRKIAEYGSDSDPRAFNFDGELNIANRGLCNFNEMLKLDVAFLYDLLGASQEKKIKPKKFAQTDIDMVIIGDTNEPEYKRLQNNEFMEALRDRTIKVDVPYVTRLRDEIAIYERDYGKGRIKDDIAPHTLEVAAMFAVMTRLEPPKHASLSMLQKMKLYDGKTIPGFTSDTVLELKREAKGEAHTGISPRFIQDQIQFALAMDGGDGAGLNPFMLFERLKNGIDHHHQVKDDDTRRRFKEYVAAVREDWEDVVKSEVQRAICADPDALSRMCGNYIDNVKAYTQREKVRNKYTGNHDAPDERLMRSIEEKIDIPEGRKDDFRREIMNYIGALAIDGRRFDYTSNERLAKALELKLFEDQKDTIKLHQIVSQVVDKATQEKIDIVKARLMSQFGYNEATATDILNFVGGIFARGQTKK